MGFHSQLQSRALVIQAKKKRKKEAQRTDLFSWQFYPSEIKDKLCAIIPLWLLCIYFPFILELLSWSFGSSHFTLFFFLLVSTKCFFVAFILALDVILSIELLSKQNKINIYPVYQIGRRKKENEKRRWEPFTTPAFIHTSANRNREQESRGTESHSEVHSIWNSLKSMKSK